MPKIFGPQEDELDLTGIDIDVDTSSQELPDEIVVDETNDASKEEQVNTEDKPAGNETPAGEAPEGQEPNSSLTPEPNAQTGNEAPPTPEELSDDRVLTYLSEKLGREVKSLEDLTPQEAAASEDPFKGDAELKAIAEWKERTGRPVSDFYKFQKDYDNMDALQAVRENLQLQYPDFTPDEIELEMEDFIVDEDIDSEMDAARKNLRLKKEAIIAKRNLNQYKSTFDTPVEARLSQEQQEAINFYAKYKEQSAGVEAQTKAYTAGIQTEASTLKSLPLNLEEGLTIDLNLSDDDRRGLPELVTKMPHWYNEDGSYNHSAIVKDAAKIANFEKAVKIAFEQGVNRGIEKEDKDSRNVDFTGARKGMPSNDDNEIVVEGAERMFDKGLKFGRRRNY